ncbi:hypothetical protein M2102_000554 [Fusobacterium sp. PH5-7]|uniref:hypothetical protein n=1 Tax=Fusobacterium TaxID=848 RepID=UPI0024738FC6|nr:hypothetical protein [Fusobacterium sp. PH5-7]MDH6456939.1 hypothetical protein [Fusobacterium sp. PH5-7]
MENLTLTQIIKIECIKQNKKVEDLCSQIGLSRQLMWHHVRRKNNEIINKIETALSLPKGTLLNLS